MALDANRRQSGKAIPSLRPQWFPEWNTDQLSVALAGALVDPDDADILRTRVGSDRDSYHGAVQQLLNEQPNAEVHD